MSNQEHSCSVYSILGSVTPHVSRSISVALLFQPFHTTSL